MATEHETPGEDETEPDMVSMIGAMVVQRLQENHGIVVCEYWNCTQCNAEQLAVHNFREVLQCTKCGHRRVSASPRRPQQGEVTLDHMVQALETLTAVYKNMPNRRWTTEAQWKTLAPEVQVMLTQNITAAAVAILKQVDSLAVGLAQGQAKIEPLEGPQAG